MKGYPPVFAALALCFFAVGIYLTAGFCEWCAFPGILPFATSIGFGPALLSLLIGYIVRKRRQRGD
jgi:uncharacterized membrane protein